MYALDHYRQAGRAGGDISKVRGQKGAYGGYVLDASWIAPGRACRCCASRCWDSKVAWDKDLRLHEEAKRYLNVRAKSIAGAKEGI